jgi:hypothetical protein
MKIIDLISSAFVKEAGNTIGNVIDDVVTNDQERMEAKKQLLEVVTKFATDISTAQASVLKTEMTGTKLQRNWRPVVMLMFAFIVVYEYFMAPVFGLPKSNLPEAFWSLLEIGLGGYVIGRSVEKITNSVSENWSTIPKKRKNE